MTHRKPTDQNGAAVLFSDVHKRFEDNQVLIGLDLQVRWGEVTTILGPSGCGKSVTLKHIIGILQADAGRVVVDGHDMREISKRDLLELRKRIGVLFQSSALFDSMTVMENVAFGLRMHTRTSEAAIGARVEECLEQVELPGSADTMPVDLSGGMRKRAALARAIALSPDIILYDEPTTGKLQRDLDITSVVVTHDIPLTLRVSDRITLIQAGRAAASGTREEIQESAEYQLFVAGELGGEDEVA